MKRWDGILDDYLRRCEARGLAPATILIRRNELDRWGTWCKRRRPRLQLETIGSEEILQYIKSRTAFHAKATVYGVVSQLRNVGEYLVEQGIWKQNPLRWIRGPKVDPRSQSP